MSSQSAIRNSQFAIRNPPFPSAHALPECRPVRYHRHKPSHPARFALELGREPVYDWGSGFGCDVAWLRSHGLDAVGWDPVWNDDPVIHPSACAGRFPVVLCVTVVNVLPDPADRYQLLDDLCQFAPPGGVIFISTHQKRVAKDQARRRGWTPVKPDGYINRYGSFLTGFTMTELQGMCQRVAPPGSTVTPRRARPPCIQITLPP